MAQKANKSILARLFGSLFVTKKSVKDRLKGKVNTKQTNSEGWVANAAPLKSGDADKTVAKTLWSDMVISSLCVGLQQNKPDEKIKELIGECKQKGFRERYLTNKVRKEVGEKAAQRIKKLM